MVTAGFEHVIMAGAAMVIIGVVLSSGTVIVLEILQPVIVLVAVKVYTPARLTKGLAIVAFEIVPGPVHNKTELAGLMVLFNVEVICEQVIVAGRAGNVIDGTLISIETFTIALSLHKLDGCDTTIL